MAICSLWSQDNDILSWKLSLSSANWQLQSTCSITLYQYTVRNCEKLSLSSVWLVFLLDISCFEVGAGAGSIRWSTWDGLGCEDLRRCGSCSSPLWSSSSESKLPIACTVSHLFGISRCDLHEAGLARSPFVVGVGEIGVAQEWWGRHWLAGDPCFWRWVHLVLIVRVVVCAVVTICSMTVIECVYSGF